MVLKVAIRRWERFLAIRRVNIVKVGLFNTHRVFYGDTACKAKMIDATLLMALTLSAACKMIHCC